MYWRALTFKAQHFRSASPVKFNKVQVQEGTHTQHMHTHVHAHVDALAHAAWGGNLRGEGGGAGGREGVREGGCVPKGADEFFPGVCLKDSSARGHRRTVAQAAA